jgi:hypothetical protein
MRFTILPVLVAFLIGLAQMPGLNIYQICAWNHGTEKTEPWRSKLSETPSVRWVLTVGARLREWCTEFVNVPRLANERGEVSLDLLTLGLTGARYKFLVQAHADTLKEIASIRDTITREARVMTDDERTKVKALDAKLDTILEDLAIEKKAQDRERGMRAVDDANAATARAAEATARVEDGTRQCPRRSEEGLQEQPGIHAEGHGRVAASGPDRRATEAAAG